MREHFPVVAAILQFLLAFLCAASSVFSLAFALVFLWTRPLLLVLIIITAAFGFIAFSIGALSGYLMLKRQHYFIAVLGPITTCGWVALFICTLLVWCNPLIKFSGLAVAMFMLLIACTALALLALAHSHFGRAGETQATAKAE